MTCVTQNRKVIVQEKMQSDSISVGYKIESFEEKLLVTGNKIKIK